MESVRSDEAIKDVMKKLRITRPHALYTILNIDVGLLLDGLEELLILRDATRKALRRNPISGEKY